MNIILSFDYELFFGHRTGTVEYSLLRPSEELFKIANRYRIPMVFFIDAGFLLKLKEEGYRISSLMRDYDHIRYQLDGFVAAGHEIQLHIHSHWEDSYWGEGGWNVNLRRYRLHDFDESEIVEIVRRYTDILRDITGSMGVFAYRAGGWVIQPFDKIRQALMDTGIRIDSTVFPGGIAAGNIHRFDFTCAPQSAHWFFDNDPLIPTPSGEFLEVPIASYRVPPIFYWRFIMAKKFGGTIHCPLGDGYAVPLSKSDLINKLSRWTTSVVTMDGYKSSFLEEAYLKYERLGMTDFVVVGHPKALSAFSLGRLEEFISKRRVDQFIKYDKYLSLFDNR